ncbi:MAG: hypothetical protein RJA44_1477 [Pseudomonadota bacterium]|jgi:type IV pilus assembly protein PilE
MPACRRHHITHGWSLIELLVALALLGLLAGLALPTYQQQVRKVRRSEAISALLQLQQAQERYRMNQTRYADTPAGLGLPELSGNAWYRLATSAHPERPASAYEVSAEALGSQSSDLDCSHLRIRVDGALLVQESGRDSRHANAADLNRQCWSQ